MLRNLLIFIMVFFPVSAFGGDRPVVDASEPHALLVTETRGAGDRVYRVKFTEIDDHHVHRNAMQHRVKPGKHEIVVTVDLDMLAKRESVRTSETGLTHKKDLLKRITIEMEAGKAYYVGAKWKGPSIHDWEPVVRRVKEAD